MSTIWTPEGLEGIKPKYKAVVAMIREGIAMGRLSVGEKLPPVRDLAWDLKITPGTVARAYTVLTDSGVLRAEVGRGTFVADSSESLGADLTEPSLNLIEVDPIRHNSGGDMHSVNLFSPHLPNGGQAELIRRLLGEVANDPPSGIMHYPSRRTARAARQAMAQWLQGAPIGRIDADDIVLSMGGQSAILLVFQTILRGRRPTVFVEDLAYPGFRRAADLLRADIVAIQCDKHGIVPEALAAAAAQHPEAQVLCTSPEVHSPTCGFTPMARRHALVDVCRKADLQILEDDCYRMGRAEGEGYRQLAPERGWYVTSLSKSLTPALRVGCAIGPKGMSAALQRSAENGFFGLPTPIIDLTAALLSHPDLLSIMARTRQGVERYVKAAVNALGGFRSGMAGGCALCLADPAAGLARVRLLPGGGKAGRADPRRRGIRGPRRAKPACGTHCRERGGVAAQLRGGDGPVARSAGASARANQRLNVGYFDTYFARPCK